MTCLGGEHSVPRGNGGWYIAPDSKLGIHVLCNGAITFAVRCGFCGQQSSSINKAVVGKLCSVGHEVTWIRDDRDADVQCVVRKCTERGYEYHHFAPRNTFPDADDWPCEPLCHKHHEYWHQMMDGYRWSSPRLAHEGLVR